MTNEPLKNAARMMRHAKSEQDSVMALARESLRLTRRTHNVSLNTLALSVGVTPAYLSFVETGRRNLSMELLERLDYALAQIVAKRATQRIPQPLQSKEEEVVFES